MSASLVRPATIANMTPQIITKAEREAREVAALQEKIKAEFPSHWEMLKNLVQAAGDVIEHGIESRTREEIETVLKICAGCPRLVNDNSKFRCGICGCYLGGRKGQGLLGTTLGKVSQKSWHCPLSKW